MRNQAHKLSERPNPWVVLTVLGLVVSCLLSAPSSALATQLKSDVVAGKTAAERRTALAKLPDVSVKSGVVVTEDGTVLWASRPYDPRPMASITKIMTALVALENSDLDEMVEVKSDRTAPGESNIGLSVGDKLPMRAMLEGLLVKSGNDAAIAIAEHVGGSTDKFVGMMNRKAKQLGLDNTSFKNPHGMDAEGHHTSARDLQKLTRIAMRNAEFRRIVRMKTTKIDGRSYSSTNVLLGSYPGTIGIKTGFTDGAGYSIVAAAKRDGRTYYAVALGNPNGRTRFDDARALLDWAYQHETEQSLMQGGTYLGTVPVRDYVDTSVGAVAAREETATVFDLRGDIDTKVELAEGVKAPVRRGSKIGQAVFTQDGEEVGRVDVVASRDVAAPTFLERVGISMTRAWRTVFGPRTKPQSTVVALDR
ncbi:MAG: D-alanyl-D-alanine carboxypeptidase [Coriobacteriales bacterium]|nr:D-alanyl-D-alanine carboxypeptidase [Coriobacteriales bacterium]